MSRTMLTLMSAAATLALAACGPKAETPQAPVENMTDTTMPEAAAPVMAPGQAFANTAAAGDAFEIATSNLAVEKSESSAVQAFAKQMVTAHTESTNKLKTAASSATPALTPDPTMTAEQQAKLTALQAKTGADFDKAYAAEQVAAHQATLDALRTYAASGDVDQLKTFASSMTPIVAAHLNMAKSLKP